MASEKAKQLAAEQKAALKAAKERRKNSTDPQDWGRIRQFIEGYKRTAELDPQLPWVLLGAGLGTAVLLTLPGIWYPPLWMWIVLGVFSGLLVATLILSSRAPKAAYKRYEGQPGSAEVALSMLNKKKWTYQSAIAATRQLDVIHRAIGPGGIVLIGEGSPGRVKQLLAAEVRKHEQVAYGVKVTSVLMGNGQGQVPLDKLTKHVDKLPRVLQPHQMTEVKQRLRALDAVRPKAPIPRGPMPSPKGVNRAMRGR